MSILHKVSLTKHLHDDEFLAAVKSEIPLAVCRANNGSYYFYVNNESIRGVDLYSSDCGYELRNNVLSSPADYRLTNTIAKVLRKIAGAVVEHEYEGLKEGELYSEISLNEFFEHDASTLYTLSGNESTSEISFWGTIRNFYWGPRLRAEFEQFAPDKKQLAQKIYELIYKVQYCLPNYGEESIMSIKGKNDKNLSVKVISFEGDYILGKYDYIVLAHDKQKEEGFLMVSNKTLNSLLPEEWQLVDEYTIIAPAISESKWSKLLKAAAPFNIYGEFQKHKN